jgi:hypothetical protein
MQGDVAFTAPCLALHHISLAPSAIRARFDGGFSQITCLSYCALRLELLSPEGRLYYSRSLRSAQSRKQRVPSFAVVASAS